jgi:3-hydroxyacyl-CoA dehydrogenase
MNHWKKVAVIGAAGKMGRGIALIVLQQMACLDAEENGSVGAHDYCLYLIDADEDSVFGLRRYFRPLLTRYAEKAINRLRSCFYDRDDLIENDEIIREYVEGALDLVRPSTEIKTARKSRMVFEAVTEDIDLKVKILSELKNLCEEGAVFFTNTSSIPIKELGQKSGLDGKLVGAHFYNPPPVQKLLEVIYPDNAGQQVKELAREMGKDLGKIAVVSRDIAGFIGNGHFIREIAFACDLYERLRKEHSHVDSLLMVDKMTRDFLVRPMGIFQLLDYVGLDVWKKIAGIMTEKSSLDGVVKPLLTDMVDRGKIGGQNMDGTQMEGFFRYQKNRITEVFDPEKDTYVPIEEEEEKHIEELLGPLPEKHIPWKKARNLEDKEKRLKIYEESLRQENTLGAQTAVEFLDRSRQGAQELVDSGVAADLDDVHTVLKYGFYHVLV